MDLPWDQPVPEDRIADVAEYCANDVITTRQTFHARKQDFVARQILADLSGLTVNHTTQQHTAKILFGDDRNPQSKFVYTDLAKEFPGYRYEYGKSYYRDEVTGEGGYVYAEPGIYENVALLDVASMHPTSLECLNLFGKEYTKNFSDLKSARLAIKHQDFASARKMLGGKLGPYLQDEQDAKALSYALKIVINIVYGLTSARFDSKFRDKRNKDNIVAKRGALFMIDLKHFVQERGFTVAHIKTDSIKIPNATEEIIRDVMLFGEKYGYTFEHEATYDKFCLVNDAVYVARKGNMYEAVGAQFQHPVVYKTLFSREQVTMDDKAETKQVSKGSMYLDFDGVDKPMALSDGDMRFVGRTGRFSPVIDGAGGALLYRFHEGKFYAVTGTKGHLWKEAVTVTDESEIDWSYFQKLIDKAVATIEKFGSFEEFVS
jgi:sulfur transfer complex TusBCD TusB component (DsrH family)